MNKTPRGNRLHIVLFGRTNVGKSSFLNMVIGQDIAITSPVAGTTTDIVEKAMELLPIGPVVFLDTAGLDDMSMLAELRLKKTYRVFDRTDIALLILEPDVWTEYEEEIIKETDRCMHCGECFSCGNCYNYCPDAAIHIDDDGRLRIDYDYCKGCGICVRECPCSAMEFKLSEVEYE